MNGRQIRTLLGIAACVAVYTTLTDAGKHIVSAPMTAANAREAWAESLSNDEAAIFFSAAGTTNSVLVIDLSSADADNSHCDWAMATLRIRQDFLVDAYNRGFRSVRCTATDANGKESTIEDNLVPPDPESPAAPPVSAAPRAVPHKSTPATSDGVAIA
jgi:hypothetical protein